MKQNKQVTTKEKKCTQVKLGEKLSAEQAAELKACEQTIADGMVKFVEVGKALATIKEKKLYKQGYSTFKAYCEKQWRFCRAHGQRHIDAAEVYKVLEDSAPNGAAPVLPSNEAQVRPLTRLAREECRGAWDIVTQRADGGKITEKMVTEVVKELKPAVRRNVQAALPAPACTAVVIPAPTQSRPKIDTERILVLLDEVRECIDTEEMERTSELIDEIKRLVRGEKPYRELIEDYEPGDEDNEREERDQAEEGSDDQAFGD